ncbi:hypothetical protein NRI82_004148 [Vibrio vulnificus]|nr:hypothetical protein [Vibrio vulnificus]
MKELTLKFEDKTVTINTHEIEGQTLYKLNDILKQYNPNDLKSPQDLTKYLSDSQTDFYRFHNIKGGKYAGSYMNQKGVIWFASKLSFEFEMAVIEAFELLLENKTQEAAQVAHSVVFDSEYAESVKQRWKAFIKWCYSYKGFASVNPAYGANVVRMVMDYALGHCRNASIKGLTTKTVIDKLIDLKHGEAIQAIDAQLGLIRRDLKRPSIQALLSSNKGKQALYHEWKVTYNWREDEDYHNTNKAA